MKRILFVFLVFSFPALYGQDISQLRKEFTGASESKSAAEKFLKTTEKLSANDSEIHLVAYRGAALIISAKFLSKIEDKKRKVKEGVALLENAISKAPDHMEARVIRLSIQENSPKIMRYKSKISEDKTFIAENFPKLKPGALKTFVSGYIENSAAFKTENRNL